MDLPQSEQDSNPSINVKQNNDAIIASVQEIEISNKSTKAECKDLNAENSLIKNIETLKSVPQEEDNDKNDDEHESVHKDSNDLAGRENVKTVEKEPIEILNVELVTTGTDDFVKIVVTNNEISEVKVSSEVGSLASSDIDTVENAEHHNEIVEETKIDTNEFNVGPTTPENPHLATYSESIEKCIQIVENVQNKTALEITKMDTIEINVVPRTAENQHLADYSKNNEKYIQISENLENETALQETKMDTIDVSVVAPTMAENQYLANCSESVEIVDNVHNDTALEGTKMGAIEFSVVPTTAENQLLANCSENIQNHTEPVKSAGLSLLAQYHSDDDSDDDSDSVEEIPLTAAQDYRHQVFEINSDTDSDDSSSSSDVEYLNELRKTIEKRIEIADEDDGEDEDQDDCTVKRRQKQKIRVKGELLLEDLPPIQDLQITVPENDCIEFGKIHSIVDQLVLVSALPNSILLDLETVIFLEKGQKVLGEVFDVLGQVADPLYCVRFNSNKQIKEKEIKIGDVVYVAPKTQYTQYVILSNIMTTRGSDASWEHDVEPPPRYLDYSDDEQEIWARKQLRNRDRPNDNEDTGKRPRTVQSDDSMSTSGSHHPNSQHRNRYEQRNNRESPAGPSNIRPRYNGPHHFQQRPPNHYRNSWHSNYNPQNFSTPPPSNFRMHSPQNRRQSPQAYHSNMPAYGMPNSHNLPYSPPAQPHPYGVPPPMFRQHSPHPMPSTLNIRPPTLHGPPHAPYHLPPPPPGCQ